MWLNMYVHAFRPFLHRPAVTFRVLAFCMQAAGGLAVRAGGAANLEGCNIFDNVAQVRAPSAPSRTFLQRPAELTVRPHFAGY